MQEIDKNPETAPEKPRFGSPCNGCGYCCISETCKIGIAAFGNVSPCPAITFDEGKFRCGLVMAEQSAGMSIISEMLGIGKGCCADDPEEDAALPP